MVLPSFWNYFHDKKKLFSQTQYEIREAVEGDKEAKVSDERHKLIQEMALFLKKKNYLCPAQISYKIELQNDR